MKKHKWENNTCVRCGIKRKWKYWRLLMAIINHPPWEAWTSGMHWVYSGGGIEKPTSIRPDCKQQETTADLVKNNGIKTENV